MPTLFTLLFAYWFIMSMSSQERNLALNAPWAPLLLPVTVVTNQNWGKISL